MARWESLPRRHGQVRPCGPVSAKNLGSAIGSDIDRYLRHAKKAPFSRPSHRDNVNPLILPEATLPQDGASGRGLEFERLIRGIFEAVEVGVKPGADLIVWHNEIA